MKTKEMRDKTQARLEEQRIYNYLIDAQVFGTGVMRVTDKSFRYIRHEKMFKNETP